MIINPVFNGVEDYETVPPANISGMFNLANHQVNLTFKIYLNLLILHFFHFLFQSRSNKTYELKTFTLKMPYIYYENLTDIANLCQKV